MSAIVSPSASTAANNGAAAVTPSLRDLFACQILPAMLIAPKEPGVPRNKMDQMAKAAYEYADALMRARDL
jgi:hypothetical protein